MKLGLRAIYQPRFDADAGSTWWRPSGPGRCSWCRPWPPPAGAPPVRHRRPVLGAALHAWAAPRWPPASSSRLQDRMPDALVSNNYGMTEAGSVYCIMPPGEAVRRPGSVGKPLPPAEIVCVDDDGTAVAAGEVGEVRLRIPGRPARVLRRSRGHRPHLGRRMAHHRRPGRHRRGRLPLHRGPEQGRHHPGRQQHPPHRRGARHRVPSRPSRGGGGRRPPPRARARTSSPSWRSARRWRPTPRTYAATPWSSWPATRSPASGTSWTASPERHRQGPEATTPPAAGGGGLRGGWSGPGRRRPVTGTTPLRPRPPRRTSR